VPPELGQPHCAALPEDVEAEALAVPAAEEEEEEVVVAGLAALAPVCSVAALMEDLGRREQPGSRWNQC